MKFFSENLEPRNRSIVYVTTLAAAVALALLFGSLANESSGQSQTPSDRLVWAIETLDPNGVAKAFEDGANPNLLLEDGTPASVLAAFTGDIGVFRSYLDHARGLDITLATPDGATIVSAALLSGNTETLAEALRAGAVDRVPMGAVRPVMLAVSQGDTTALQMMVDAGANLARLPGERLSAADLAQEAGNTDLEMLIRRLNATNEAACRSEEEAEFLFRQENWCVMLAKEQGLQTNILASSCIQHCIYMSINFELLADFDKFSYQLMTKEQLVGLLRNRATIEIYFGNSINADTPPRPIRLNLFLGGECDIRLGAANPLEIYAGHDELLVGMEYAWAIRNRSNLRDLPKNMLLDCMTGEKELPIAVYYNDGTSGEASFPLEGFVDVYVHSREIAATRYSRVMQRFINGALANCASPSDGDWYVTSCVRERFRRQLTESEEPPMEEDASASYLSEPVPNNRVSAGNPVVADTAPATMTILPSTDFLGGDLIAEGIKGFSFSECREWCLSDDRCSAVSYVPTLSWCWPKHSTDVPQSNEEVISAKKD